MSKIWKNTRALSGIHRSIFAIMGNKKYEYISSIRVFDENGKLTLMWNNILGKKRVWGALTNLFITPSKNKLGGKSILTS